MGVGQSFRLCRIGFNAGTAGGIFGGTPEAPMDTILLRVYAYDSLVWRRSRRLRDDSLHRPAGEAAFQSARPSRTARQLDRRRQHSRRRRRALFQVQRAARRERRAVGVIAGRLRLQAFTLSIIDGFHLTVWACVCALILICFVRRSPYSYGELSAIQQATVGRRNGSI